MPPAAALAISVPVADLGARGDEVQVAGPEQIVDSSAQLGIHVHLDSVRLEVDLCAVLKAERELQFTLPGVASNDLVDLSHDSIVVFSFIHTDDDATGVSGVEFLERNDLIDDQVGRQFIKPDAAIII